MGTSGQNGPESLFTNMTAKHSAKPLWLALINHRIVLLPRSEVPADLLRTLALIGPSEVLVRDYLSPHDEIIPAGANVNLEKGNVFYSEPSFEKPHPHSGSAKLAYSVNDRAHVAVLEEIPVKALVELFGLPPGTHLVHELESGNGQPVSEDAVIRFKEGPCFLAHVVDKKHVDVVVVTTGGSFPDEGFERLPINQEVKEQLAKAAKALKLGDVSTWVAKVDSRDIDAQKSYAANGLTGKVEIDFGPPAGGGGAA